VSSGKGSASNSPPQPLVNRALNPTRRRRRQTEVKNAEFPAESTDKDPPGRPGKIEILTKMSRI
jgi:hypothetical protein